MRALSLAGDLGSLPPLIRFGITPWNSFFFALPHLRDVSSDSSASAPEHREKGGSGPLRGVFPFEERARVLRPSGRARAVDRGPL